ncbi:hypothetical protein AA313_de0207417 [Arthrobotrys entomopaga]|nr:hypothetical protein AA313_de0207417 [Arthrobotrys entomopaga]
MTIYSVVTTAAKRSVPRVHVRARDNNNAYNNILVPPSATLKARQVTEVPSSVPTYASACSGTARYSSACSCGGVTADTVYAPTPLLTGDLNRISTGDRHHPW